MSTGYRGTFVVSWGQTELDGLPDPHIGDLAIGATWSWRGPARRIDGPNDVLLLDQSDDVLRIRRHASRVAQRLVTAALERSPVTRVPEAGDPLLSSGFALTDGLRCYAASLVEVPDKPRLLVFVDQVPPEGVDLWVTHIVQPEPRIHRLGDAVPAVICFTPETQLATPSGRRRLADLRPGDHVDTLDNGPQPIQWIGTRRISGARLVAMPRLRPVRIRGGALGLDIPDEDLVVSPDHRLLMRGPQIKDVYGEDEALVTARDLVDGRHVLRDRQGGHVTYVHVLLDAHQIVIANGLPTESFHPATMPLDALGRHQREALFSVCPDLIPDGSNFGAFARRMLSSADAAILMARPMRAY